MYHALHYAEKVLNLLLEFLVIQVKRLWIWVVMELNRIDGELSQGLKWLDVDAIALQHQ